MEEKLVSIIMPAYNAEAYLPKSIVSVQNQTYQNWELLIVDDGSADGSRELVRAMAQKDPRIKLICNQHGGTARARNTALELAKGEFLAFIDADDAYHPQYLRVMLAAMHQTVSDISICQIVCGEDESILLQEEIVPNYLGLTAQQVFNSMYGGNWQLYSSHCNKLYKRCFINELRFPDGRCFEDIAIVHRSIYSANQICLVSNALYFYHWTPGSSSKTKRSNELFDRESALRSHWEFFFQEGREDLAYGALPFYIVELISIYHRIEHSDNPDDCEIIRKRFYETLKKYQRHIRFTEEQKDEVLKFTNPTLYDLRNMVRADGVWGTICGFAKRKYEKLCKIVRK